MKRMKQSMSLILLLVTHVALGSVKTVSTNSDFNKSIAEKEFAVVHINPFPAEKTPPPMQNLSEAFEAVSDMQKYTSIKFITANLHTVPELGRRFGINFNVEQHPAQSTPEMFPSTVLLFRNGMVLKENARAVQLKGFFVNSEGSEQPLVSFIDKYLGSYLPKVTQPSTETSATVQTPTTVTRTVVYDTPTYYSAYPYGVGLGLLYPWWWQGWWGPRYRYRGFYPWYGGRRFYRGGIGRPFVGGRGVIGGRGAVVRRGGFVNRGIARPVGGFAGRGFRGGVGGGAFRGGGFRGGMRGGGFRGGGRRR